ASESTTRTIAQPRRRTRSSIAGLERRSARRRSPAGALEVLRRSPTRRSRMTITRLSLAKTRLRYSYCFGACRDTTKRRPGRGSDFAFRSRPLMRPSLPQPSHELVQGAFAAAITGQPHTSQDFGAREVRTQKRPVRARETAEAMMGA